MDGMAWWRDLTPAERESLRIRDAAWCEARIAEDLPILGEMIYLDRPLRIPSDRTAWIERCQIETAEGGDVSWLVGQWRLTDPDDAIELFDECDPE